jgi:outer membrane cobalamin receptor
MLWTVRLFLPLALALYARLVAAQEPPPRDLDPVVITATKYETRAEQLGASVTVVPGDDVQRYHYETVEDVLRTVPGVEVRRAGSIGKLSNISIRGANANQVQVLVDGVRVKSPTTGQADLSDISPDLIERIEVIRGPQSTLYGADAIGGVVNIITKKGTGGPFSATIERGTTIPTPAGAGSAASTRCWTTRARSRTSNRTDSSRTTARTRTRSTSGSGCRSRGRARPRSACAGSGTRPGCR